MANLSYLRPEMGTTSSSQPRNGHSNPAPLQMAGQSPEPGNTASPLAVRPPSSNHGGASAVEALVGAAELLRNAAETGEKILDGIHAASRQLHAFAHFLESHPARTSFEKGKRFVKRHPLESVIALAMAAFLLGRASSKLEHRQPGTD